MFPGAGASVYYNSEGEPLGWDYPGDEPYDPDDYLNGEESPEDYDEDDESERGPAPTQDNIRAWLGDTYGDLTEQQREDVLIAARDIHRDYPDPAEVERNLSEFVRGMLSDEAQCNCSNPHCQV